MILGNQIWSDLEKEKRFLFDLQKFDLQNRPSNPNQFGIALHPKHPHPHPHPTTDHLLQYFTDTHKISLTYLLEYLLKNYLPNQHRLINRVSQKLNIRNFEIFKRKLTIANNSYYTQANTERKYLSKSPVIGGKKASTSDGHIGLGNGLIGSLG
jgi:hypothetical protein